jgi:hypothetical protein
MKVKRERRENVKRKKKKVNDTVGVMIGGNLGQVFPNFKTRKSRYL